MPCDELPFMLKYQSCETNANIIYYTEGNIMARVCEICGKSKDTGHQVSHSNIKTKRTWNVNIQKVKVKLPSGIKKRANVCTRCLKAGRAKKAV